MRLFLLFVFSLILVCNVFGQNPWDLVWRMEDKPFQSPDVGSEMAIVKGGFDTDEDGWGEFLCAYTDLDSNYILMYEASGNDTYDLVWYWKYPLPANTFAGIEVGDMDNNGVVEIITTMPTVTGLTGNENPPRLWVFEWTGEIGENKYGSYDGENFEPTADWNLDVDDQRDFRPYSLTIEDIDKDGDNELIVANRYDGVLGREIIVASVLGEFSVLGSWNIEYHLKGLTGGSLYSVTTGDLDNDGNREIYAMVWNNFKLKIIECTGVDQYALVAEIDELYQPQGIDYGALDGIRVADVNNDGTNELYIAGTEEQNIVFMITDITDVSQVTGDDVQEFYHIEKKGLGGFRSMQIADPDQDGNPNLMIAGEKNGQIYDLEYDGDGDPADTSNWDLTICFDIFEYSGVSEGVLEPRLFYGYPAGDMDNDGKDEYLFVNYHTDAGQWADDAYVWILESGVVNAIAINKDILPTEALLMQNYPNPFNPATTIEYALPANRFVTIKIYNSLGQEVATLVNSEKPAGMHRVTFDAGHLPSGTYYVQMNVSDADGGSGSIQSRKIVLLK